MVWKSINLGGFQIWFKFPYLGTGWEFRFGLLEVYFAHYWRNVFVEQLTLHSVVCRIYPLTNGECQHHDTSLPRSQSSRVQTPSSTFPVPTGYQLVCITAWPPIILLLPLCPCPLTHLLPLSTSSASLLHRCLAPSHPLFRILAPYFQFLLAINWYVKPSAC